MDKYPNLNNEINKERINSLISVIITYLNLII